MIDKNLKVLDLADGVEKLANISSFDVNSTITDSDLMLIEQSTALKKVTIGDLKTEIGGGGGGNTYTISLPFSKGGGNVDGTVTVPENAVLLFAWLKINNELSTGGAPFQFRLAGSSPLVIAEQGVDFSEFVGSDQFYRAQGSQGGTLPEGQYEVTSTDSGVLQANHSGSGFGDGIIYLQYSTALS